MSDPACLSEIDIGDVISPKFSGKKRKTKQEVRRNVVKLQMERQRLATKSAMDSRPSELLLSPERSPSFKIPGPKYFNYDDEVKGRMLFDSNQDQVAFSPKMGRRSVAVPYDSKIEESEMVSQHKLTPNKIQVFQRT